MTSKNNESISEDIILIYDDENLHQTEKFAAGKVEW